MIGTHNSATGETARSLFGVFIAPFSVTQDLTLAEQYLLGTRCYDLRIAKRKGKWHAAHGLWTSKKTFEELMRNLNSVIEEQVRYTGGSDRSNIVVVDVILERHCKRDLADYMSYVNGGLKELQQELQYVKFRYIGRKYDEDGNGECFGCLAPEYGHMSVQRFKNLSIKKWACLWPLPRFWARRETWVYDKNVINFYDFFSYKRYKKVLEETGGKIVTWEDFLP